MKQNHILPIALCISAMSAVSPVLAQSDNVKLEINAIGGHIVGDDFSGVPTTVAKGKPIYLMPVAPAEGYQLKGVKVRHGKNIKGDLSAIIDVDGNLVVSVMLVDMDDEEFNVEMQFGKQEEEPFEPVSMAGTLSSFSRTDDGDVSDQKASLLTITDEGDGKCTLTMTEGTLPGTTLSLGTITIPSVSYEADEATATMNLSSGKVEATTECAHPFYQTITVKSLSGTISVKDDENSDADLANANITFSVDNNGTETVEYTFSTNGYVTGVDTVKKADGSVKHIYTISGIATTQMQRGVNIVRHADGTVTKVVKK